MNLLEYLRKSFLDEIGFSKEAFIIDDPYGVPMGVLVYVHVHQICLK